MKKSETSSGVNETLSRFAIFWKLMAAKAFNCRLRSINQDIQEKLRDDIKTTLSKYNNEITYDGMMEMKYLQMVIDETLRLYGPVFSLKRQAVKEYKIPKSNLVIPAKGNILIPIHAIHTDPEYYPEPERFIPERFSEENKKSRHTMLHLPFGDGPRNCIGLRFGLMQTKISLIQLLINFKFSPSPKTPVPMVLHTTSVVMAPRDDMHLKVEKL